MPSWHASARLAFLRCASKRRCSCHLRRDHPALPVPMGVALLVPVFKQGYPQDVGGDHLLACSR